MRSGCIASVNSDQQVLSEPPFIVHPFATSFDGSQVALDGGVHPVDELFPAKARGGDALLIETARISIRHEFSLVHDYEHRSPP